MTWTGACLQYHHSGVFSSFLLHSQVLRPLSWVLEMAVCSFADSLSSLAPVGDIPRLGNDWLTILVGEFSSSSALSKCAYKITVQLGTPIPPFVWN